MRKLNLTTSAVVINHLKSKYLQKTGYQKLISDNGPQYSSQEFSAFCKQWGIDHVTSLPLYPQSNGFIERSVQTVRNHLRNAEASGQDPYLALLTYRTTPVDSSFSAVFRVILINDCSSDKSSSHRRSCRRIVALSAKVYSKFSPDSSSSVANTATQPSTLPAPKSTSLPDPVVVANEKTNRRLINSISTLPAEVSFLKETGSPLSEVFELCGAPASQIICRLWNRGRNPAQLA